MRGKFFLNVFFLALAAATTAWFIVPRWNNATGATEFSGKSVGELQADETVYNDAFSKMREIEVARTGLAASYNAISEADRTRLVALLPDHADSVRIVLDIENAARAHGLKLRNVSATPPALAGSAARQTEGARAVPIVFAVSAVGTYEEFVPFLADLEASVRLADITSVSFEAKTSDYVFGVSFRAYQLSESTSS